MTDLRRALEASLSATFAEMAFLFLFEEQAVAEGELAVAEIVFTRGSSGETGVFHLAVSRTILPELAANMLGSGPEEPTTAGDQEDALKEAANVVCGHFLPAIAGVEAVWNVSAPVIVAEEQWREADLSADLRARIFLESGVARAFVRRMAARKNGEEPPGP